MNATFKVGDTIKNRKTSKLGIVTYVYEEGIIKYHLIDTPHNIHISVEPEERFIIIKKD